MKKLVLLTLVVIALASCGKEKKADTPKVETKKEAVKKEVKTTNVVGNEAQIAKGKKLFTSKTCVACHQVDKKVIGPSIKEIVKIYTDKNANMVKFLKGNAPAIVDTDPAQVAVMKANLDGFVKDMKAEELQAVVAYMRNVSK